MIAATQTRVFFLLAKWPKDILEYTLLQAVQQYLKGTL
jgi:hypothetical protein